MKRRRAPTEEERALFREAVAGAKPIVPDRVHHEPPPPPAVPQQRWRDEAEALAESLDPAPLDLRLEGGDEPTFLRPGLARTVLRDLRRGRWVIQDEIDLHGANRDEARQLLATFLAACLHHGVRCVRVITGKGLGSPQKLSILRQLTRGWLAQREEVLAYCQARPHDGGEGALLVLLRAPKKTRAA